MLTSFFSKITAFFMSIFMFISGLFGGGGGQSPDNGAEEAKPVKNVIYLIGDGMGFNHLEKTKKELGITLTMDSFEIKGSSKTRSLSSSVTDSAAGCLM